jgi:hypothetical protein
LRPNHLLKDAEAAAKAVSCEPMKHPMGDSCGFSQLSGIASPGLREAVKIDLGTDMAS